AREIITGFARLGGRAVGIVANQSKVKGGVLFVDSSDKGARFIWLCNAYNIPLVYLADVSGFMVGSKVERAAIIRHGAKIVLAARRSLAVKGLLTACRYLTAVPLPRAADPGDLGPAAGWFPVVGFVLGGILALAGVGADIVTPPSVAAVLLVSLWALLTGGLH